MALVALFRGAEREIESDRELVERRGSASWDGDGEPLGVAYRPEGGVLCQRSSACHQWRCCGRAATCGRR